MRLAVVGLSGLFACGPSSFGANDTTGSSLSAKNITADGDGRVSVACTPSGPELCFNATDDNCNGVIDEGCGSATGVLQFMIAWGDSPADLDLAVMDPAGKRVHKSSRETTSGLTYEKNCPDEGCHGQNVENVVFAGNDPPRGKYVVEVRLTDARAASLPVKARLSARVGSRTFAMDLVLSPEDGRDKQGFSFEL